VKLQVVRRAFIERGQCRGTVNRNVWRIKKMFKWATSQELVRPDVYQGLQALAGLQKGRSDAREGKKVLPVDRAVIDATLAQLGSVLADMVRVQLLTGMRPAEVCIVRPADIDRNGDVWEYRPSHHKLAWRENTDRVVFLGTEAQRILRPYLLRSATSYCFCPRESAGRGGERYDTASYRRAIKRAAERANVPAWCPGQLRHTAATTLRKQYGLEASQVILGHRRCDVTQVYAEKNWELGRQVAREIG
jgi:integrase